jgi:hypothetical protein
VEINPADLERAAKALRDAGFRVQRESDTSLVKIEVFRHYGIRPGRSNALNMS